MDYTELEHWLRRPHEPEKYGESESLRGAMLDYIPPVDSQLPLREQLLLLPWSGGVGAPPHSHSYYELQYVYAGSLTQELDGRKLRVPEGGLCLIAPRVSHRIARGVKGDLRIDFLLSRALVERPLFRLGLEESTPFTNLFAPWTGEAADAAPSYVLLDTGNDDEAKGLAMALFREYFFPRSPSAERRVAQLLPLFLNASYEAWWDGGDGRRLGDSSGTGSAKGGLDVEAVLGFVELRLANIGLEATAAHFGYSPNHLNTLLKAATGQSFIQLKHKLCLQRAAALLLQSKSPVDEIIAGLGFSNRSHFYRLFAAAYGMTPAAYRKRASEG